MITARGGDCTRRIVAHRISLKPWAKGAERNLTLRAFLREWPKAARAGGRRPPRTAAWRKDQDPQYHFRRPTALLQAQWDAAAETLLPHFAIPAGGGAGGLGLGLGPEEERGGGVGRNRHRWDHSAARRAERALFGLGPAGSGPYFHVHPAAYNALVWGRKRWLL
jgi:hypothetical protein